MKLCVIAQKLDRPETEMLRLLATWKVDLLCMADPECPNFKSLNNTSIECRPLHLKSRLDIPGIKKIRSAIHAFQPDLVQCLRNNYPVSNALIATLGLKVKHACYRGTMGNLSRWDPGSWMTYLNPRVDRIWCVSKGVEEYLSTMSVPREKLVTIYKGHDPSWYPSSPAVTRKTLALPANAFLIGTSGALRPLKGIPVLLEALTLLDPDLDVHCVLVGDVQDEEVTRMADSPALADKVTFTGFRPDAPQIMGLCNAFVMPSLRREGLPRSMMEAMAQGVPVIVSDIGGMSEVVDEGETGFIVPPGDAKALAHALSALIQDRARSEQMGRAALKKLEGPLNVETSARQLLNVYKELMK